MTIMLQKLEALRSRLTIQGLNSGAILVVYPPEEELNFCSGYREIIRELEAKYISIHVVDFRTLIFDLLERRDLLQKAFRLDASGSRDIFKNLANMVQRESLKQVTDAAKQAPEAIIFCFHTVSLYPWISYSALLEETENRISNTLIIPFPGMENGPSLHLMGAKDGYNYRAARI